MAMLATLNGAGQIARGMRGLMGTAVMAMLVGACADKVATAPDVQTSTYGSYGSYGGGGGSWGGNGPYRAVSYINPDIGAATANADVNANSSCSEPDQFDTQTLSPDGTTRNNVHNDACLFGGSDRSFGDEPRFDGPATYESTGVGVISACPDPDGAGPKTATLSADRKRCIQTGFQVKGVAGDGEFHARLNNTSALGGAGTQRVVWCYDPELNGCADARIKSTVSVNWVR